MDAVDCTEDYPQKERITGTTSMVGVPRVNMTQAKKSTSSDTKEPISKDLE